MNARLRRWLWLLFDDTALPPTGAPAPASRRYVVPAPDLRYVVEVYRTLVLSLPYRTYVLEPYRTYTLPIPYLTYVVPELKVA